MKRGLFMVCLVAVLFVFMCFMSVAFADTVHHTITFHSGDGGLFSDGTDVHVVEYGNLNTEDITMISHTSNVADDGTLISGYGNQWDIVNVVTIPNASFLNVTFRYGTASSGAMSDTEYACVWIGNHPSYKAATDFSLSYTGKLTGNSNNPNNVKHYMFRDQSVTFGFRSNRVAANDPRYGYHAVVTFPAGGYFLVNDCVYEDPIPSLSGWKLVGWSTSPDGSGTMYENPGVLSETMDLYAVYEEDVVASGTYRNVDWKFRKDGVLFLGDENEEQTFAYVDSVTGQAGANYPWYKYRASIINVVFSNKVYGTSSMQGMFEGCAFSSIDLTNFDTSQVINFNEFFSECRALTSLDATQFDLSSGERFGLMFEDCVGLTTINIDNWDMSRAKDLGGLFEGCTNLMSLNVSNWNISSAEYIGGMFRECSKLATIDVSRWDTSNVKNMSYMFYKCSKLTTIDVSDWDTSSVTNMGGMFGSCSQLITVDVSNFDTSNVTDFSSMFSNCTRVAVLDVSQWDTSSAIDMNNMFYYCGSVEVLDISNFDVSHVEKAYAMFRSCSSVKELDVSDWYLSHIVESQYNPQGLCYMFASCSGLTSLDLSNWDPSTVKNFAYMFSGCRGLLELDLSSWNTPVLQRTEGMFENCASLESLNLQNFDTTQMNSAANMFKNCSKLAEITFGENYHFLNASTTLVPTPPARYAGILYTQKWIREDKAYGPYTPAELATDYDSSMAGKWVWERAPMEYTLNFVPPDDTYVGSMPQVKPTYSQSYVLPENAFALFGYVFDHWDDGRGHTYVDQDTIPANTYAIGTEVILTAIFIPVDTSVVMHDGAFDFTLKADEQALFIPVPASTSYQVYEQTPFGWSLIKQSNNVGEIMPDKESEALFLNKYDPLKVTIRFAGTKLMNESVADPDSFNFLLYEDETLIDIASVSEGGAIEFQSIEYDAAGDHHYYIKEVIGSDNIVEYDTHVEEITVSITSDGVGHLSANVTMDEDEILFENKSKPGMLALRKLNATTEDRDGVFYYEVQFSFENGQPYDLLSSDISYEEREGNVSDFPEVQPLPEKPKHTLTVNHVAKRGNSETVQNTITAEYTVGEVVMVNAVNIPSPQADYYYTVFDSDDHLIRSSEGVYKIVMPDHDLEVSLYYQQYQDLTATVRWNDINCTDNLGVSLILYADDEQTDVVDVFPVGDTHTFVKYPVYNADGNRISYKAGISPLDGYITWNSGILSVVISPGFEGRVIWDDFDNEYNMRPNMVYVEYDQRTSGSVISSSRSVSASDNWKYQFVLQYAEDEYPVDNVHVVSVPSGYVMVTSEEDPGLDVHDVKLKLISEATIDRFKWISLVNAKGNPNLPMRSATSFVRNVAYESVDDLPDAAVRIDSGVTAYPIYFWMDGTDAYWWSNADTVYLGSGTSCQEMFYDCASLISLDLSDFNTSKVGYMTDMFFRCSGLTSLNISNWDTHNVLSMNYMFCGCSSLQELDISSLDTRNVTTMRSMFASCQSLRYIDVSTLNTSKVTDVSFMFSRCSSLESIDVSTFDTKLVTSMDGMFSGCTSLVMINLSALDTSRVEYMGRKHYDKSGMFEGCSNLTTIIFGQNFDTSSVKSMYHMFQDCESLTTIDLSKFDTHNVTDMEAMFSGCRNLLTIDVSDFDTSNVTSTVQMFKNCSSLTTLDVSGLDMENVTTIEQMFYGCSGLTGIDISMWNTSSLQQMNSAFGVCSGIVSVNLTGIDMHNVVEMNYVFSNCTSLTTIDLSGMDVGQVTQMIGLFSNCTSLSSVVFDNWNTASLVRMDFLFSGCANVETIDMSSFDTSAVTKMDSAFDRCTKLKTIFVGDDWATNNVISWVLMFQNCYAIEGEQGTVFNSGHIDGIYARIDNPPDEPGYFTYKATSTQP